ncbi:hypothetical protein [Bordetella genomosp. 9]|uniref:Uncharacterized protein n=1 Tax=Bordetella genomosp. 9 TaxID=1416803 RepID=A0A1W6YXW5_9BORD|nr:hypothetical protein [Bordetella genomosp. 9]ARP85945.1 hypothetical protein CAL13_06820 [Bordetella genomosp. 9]ARP89966.1 hypothetical protein CAL14_06415 [Bordetella genomosp. 9]
MRIGTGRAETPTIPFPQAEHFADTATSKRRQTRAVFYYGATGAPETSRAGQPQDSNAPAISMEKAMAALSKLGALSQQARKAADAWQASRRPEDRARLEALLERDVAALRNVASRMSA